MNVIIQVAQIRANDNLPRFQKPSVVPVFTYVYYRECKQCSNDDL